MLTRIIGDIHGMTSEYQAYCIEGFDGPTIQIGDFGVGFGQTEVWYEQINALHSDGTHRFIRGNHDNPRTCKSSMVGYIADGTVEGDTMFIGGAWSIDNPWAPPGWYRRTPEVNWWADEECSDQEFELIFKRYLEVKPRVMITHDCPSNISYSMFWETGLIKGPAHYNRTGDWFNRFFEAHQPDLWLFGHWHYTSQYEQVGTRFQCIGELEYVDVDL